MHDYLLQHARETVWCNGDQDHQLIFAAHKITPDIGVLNRFSFMNRLLTLPSLGKRFHIYQIGQIHPIAVGLISRYPLWTTEKWWSFKDAINTSKVICNLYNNDGINLPRYKSYYMFTRERNLIVAIEEDLRYPVDYINDILYLRLYSNAYYESLRADAVEDYIHCEGRIVTSITDILSFQMTYEQYAAKVGHVDCYKNGLLIDSISLSTIDVNDSVELVYDSSVKRVVTFTVNQLSTFLSTLDNKYKYLLSYDSIGEQVIDYQDDIDIHILHQVGIGFTGNYYHRNAIDSHRMVTHRDYSLVVDYFTFIATALNDLLAQGTLDIRNFKIQCTIRHSGYERPLIFDHHRIFELYKLSYTKRLQAMVGINATVDVWKAASLENSAYTQIMRSEYLDITPGLVETAYGYNGISTLIANTPSHTVLNSGLQGSPLPYGLHENITVYEYDADGLMIGYHTQTQGYEYTTSNLDTRLIEAVVGRGTYQPDVWFGTDGIALPVIDNYRVYMCYLVNDIPNEQWVDITDSPLYTVVNNTLTWSGSETDQYLMVRSDATFLAYDLDIRLVRGIFFFTLAELEERFGVVDNYTLPVPLGQLDIFLNGHSLIEGIDYVVDFPKVYILSKKFLIEPIALADQHIHVRFMGFCQSDLKMDVIEDTGYIEHGFLSNNNRHDIRDDKVMRIVVNGSTKHRDTLVFSEQHDGISITNPINGYPYQIKDIVVPMKQLTQGNTYTLREQSIAIDTAISDYLTIKLPQPARDALNAIVELYPITHLFIAQILSDVITDIITPDDVNRLLSDNDIMSICKPYEYLLTLLPDTLKPQYTLFHPTTHNTNVEVTVYEYRFIQRVIDLYCPGLSIASFVTITATGV